MHTGEKLYQFNKCIKIFAQKRDLVIHQITLTGEKICHFTEANTLALITFFITGQSHPCGQRIIDPSNKNDVNFGCNTALMK